MSDKELPTTATEVPPEGIEQKVAPTEADMGDKSISDYKPKAINLNVKLQYPVDKPYTLGDAKAVFGDPNLHMTFINGTLGDLQETTTNHPNVEVSDDAGTMRWIEALNRGSANLIRNEPFQDSLEAEGGDWQQTVDYAGQPLGISRPRFAEAGTVLTGERAVMRMTAALGLGTIHQVPLWHTGIWVSFKAPSEAAILELERRVGQRKTTLGRMTNGLVFSNTSVHLINDLLDFALQHVYDTNAKEMSPQYLESIVLVTDIPLILWGLASAIYPNGYPYSRGCISTDKVCNHIFEALLNLSKLMWTDRSKLSEWQTKRMSQRKTRMSDEDLKRYAEEHKYNQERTVSITDNIRISLAVPTIEQYYNSGNAWIANIIKVMEGAFGEKIGGDERDAYITNQGRLTNLRQYGHWVKQIHIEDAEIGTDRDTVENLMGVLTADEESRDLTLKAVTDYINSVTISLIGLPKHECPVCHANQVSKDEERFSPYVVPLDVAQVFFTLLNQRIYKVLIKSSL